MKNLIMIAAGCLLAIGFAACDATDDTTDTIGDYVQPCTVVPGTTVKASCEQYLDVLCARHVACGTYASMETCTTWFVSEYGNCAEAPTDGIDAVAQANLKVCLCDLPTASCVSLTTNGAEATVPECGNF